MGIVKWILKAVALVVVLGIAIVIGLAVSQAGECTWACSVMGTGSQTATITVPSSTGIGGRIIGDLYTPYPGARTQVRERSDTGIVNTIRAYIEPSGRIVDPDTGQEIGTIDGLFSR